MKIIDKNEWFEKELKKLDNDIESLSYKYVLDFSENVLEILNQKGIKNKNKHLAKRLNCSPAYISKLFNGRSNFTIKKLVEIAQVIGCDLDIRLRHKLVEVSSQVYTASINVNGKLVNYTTFKPDVSVSYTADYKTPDYKYEPQAA
jgi:transcriptional regulator with XRE-family HTH domain